MPSPEKPGEEPQKEEEPKPAYCKAARFASEESAGQAYFQTQEAILNVPCDLSTYRFQLQQIWHVAVVGEPPSEELEQQLDEILSGGARTSLPPEILFFFQERRRQAAKFGSRVERHYRPGKRFKW
ncbi:MAG: hypothetical protein M5U01_19560 [Ardenticatenaceae bacterium]|nr:hypothetical protein [Ardenticatenaceae bacterium]